MGYFDNSGNIREELLDQEAGRLAESFVKRDQRDPTRTIKNQSLSSAQLRRFFSEFRQLEKRIAVKGFDQVKPLIKMVKSKASYAANRQPAIPPAFKHFLINNVNQINTQKDFEAFMLHFEAVVGFFYGIEGIRNE
jgi:CRISPR-associated protein Csm2